MSNLLENALRYGESAQIALKDSAENLVIEIRDKGSGIPADNWVPSSDNNTVYQAADANQDDTVTLEELIAYRNENQNGNQSGSNSEEMNVMKIMLRLMEAYSLSYGESTQASASTSISAIAWYGNGVSAPLHSPSTLSDEAADIRKAPAKW